MYKRRRDYKRNRHQCAQNQTEVRATSPSTTTMPLPESHPNSVPFPPEIISIIIELLLPEDPPRCEYDGIDNESIRKIPDLSTSMQISKLWHAQALPYRFRRVMIAVGNYSDSDEPSGYLKAEERIKAFLDLVVARPQIAACVRELDIMFLGYGKSSDDIHV